jgi:signal transduction histidine kinase
LFYRLQRIYKLFQRFSRAKQPEYTSKIAPQVERTVLKTTRYLRVLLFVALIWLLGLEFAEIEFRKKDIFQIGEILIYLGLIAALGLLIEVVVRARNVRPVHQKINLMATMMLQRIENSVTRFAKLFRLAIAAALVLLVGVETAEFEFNITDTFHIGEILIYFVLLGTLGLLVEVILLVHKKQQRSIDLLNYKHKMSLQLLSHHSWESLTGLMTRQLADVVHARAAYLYLYQPLTRQPEAIGEWVEGKPENGSAGSIDCQICPAQITADMAKPHLCDIPAGPANQRELRLYCFPVLYKDSLYALFRFDLPPGQEVTEEQQEVLTSISDEVIVSLMAGQDRKRISELELAKTALAERHAMSHYLHDNLGQNLGYLRMKLEQFVNDPRLLAGKEDEFKAELKIMRDVVDESYRFVRNKLEVTIPDSTPLLVNYLQEHAKKVSKRSNLAVQFSTEGVPRVVSLDLQQACFFIFQEALSNIEKHSHASKVSVLVKWSINQLLITISDNGTGFDIHKVASDRHFGLEIMRERISGIGGSVEIHSSPNRGTTIQLNAPLPAI